MKALLREKMGEIHNKIKDSIEEFNADVAEKLEYAEYCMALSQYAAEEAALATLCAERAQEIIDSRK